jgi:hypothetical protein
MNLLDAAIEVLKDHKRGALSAEDVVRIAVEKKLVQKGGAATVKALVKHLADEAKADDGRVAAQDGGYVARKAKAGKKPVEAPKAEAKGKKAPAGKKPAAEAKGKKAPAGKKPTKKPTVAETQLELPKDELEPAASEPTETELLGPDAGFAPASDTDPGIVIDEAQDDDDEDAIHERVIADAAAHHAQAEAAVTAALTPEEQELSALYGEELSTPATAIREFKDPRTADEDRPMTPEINARDERNKRWEQRRDERRSRRDADRSRRQDERGPRPAEAAPAARDAAPARDAARRPELRELPGREPRPAPIAPVAPIAAPAEGAAEHVTQRVGNALGDAAWQVFASLKNGQPMPVRQLAQMMRKRGLIETDPEQVWPHLKAALLGDERSYRGLGLRPRIVYRGRDLFAPGPVAASATATAEAGVATALSSLAVATHRALKERIAQAGHAGFERLAHAYLVSMGYNDIEWIKRTAGISYATALPPDGSSAILVSARSGDAPVDRRGVGELRVGVEAKNLLAGLLLAARELAPEAERELERAGRSIAVVCGDALVSALLQNGVGVVTVAAPLRYVDDQMLDELLAG